MRFLFGVLITVTCVHLHAQRSIVLNGKKIPVFAHDFASIEKEEGVKQYGQGDTIQLAKECRWEIYDQYGNLVRKGVSMDIPVRGLQAGGYYLIYDHVTTQIAVFNEEHRGQQGK